MKRMKSFLLLVLLGTLFTGCVTSPMVNTVMNPNVPIEDHAVLYIPGQIMDVTVDGDKVKSGHEGGGVSERAPMIMLPPGKHSIQARYASLVVGSSSINSGFFTIVHTFKAGGRYYFFANPDTSSFYSTSFWGEKQGNISIGIVDETDPAAAWEARWVREAEERVAKANSQMDKVMYPSKIALSLTHVPLMENAVNADPTKFEGTWRYIPPKRGDTSNTYTYRFTGNLYFFEHKYGNHPEDLYGSFEQGTFELNDNTITFTALQESGKGWIRLLRLINSPKQTVTQYAYSITDEGLFVKTNKETLGPFKRVETQK